MGKTGIYIHIPFCVKKCNYCAFLSFDAETSPRGEYTEALCEEIRLRAAFMKDADDIRSIDTVYIGGGTPSILSTEYLSEIFDCIRSEFDLSEVSEFTLEAGRPDTLEREKLLLIKNSLVTRLTINAQSFNDETLKKIGRNHTSSDVYNAYKIVRELGFDNINTDLIAGLPDESVEDFIDSLNKTISLNAENITIHTLLTS